MKPTPSAARRSLAHVVDAVAEATVAPSFSRAGIALRRRLEGWERAARLWTAVSWW